MKKLKIKHPVTEKLLADFLDFAIFQKGDHRTLAAKYMKYLNRDFDITEYPVDHPFFNFSTRALNVFESSGCYTFGDLINKSPFELLRTRNCGTKTLQEIKSIVESHGYFLR